MNAQHGLKSTSLRPLESLPKPGSDFVRYGGPGIVCTRFGHCGRYLSFLFTIFVVLVCRPCGQGNYVHT
jgi:hypothetical protein